MFKLRYFDRLTDQIVVKEFDPYDGTVELVVPADDLGLQPELTVRVTDEGVTVYDDAGRGVHGVEFSEALNDLEDA